MNPFKGSGGPIYRRWWFWVIVLLLSLLTLYAKGYYDWKGDYEQGRADDYARALIAQSMHQQNEQLEEQYKNDTYGGNTPEETIRLFVEALENRDFELAAKYYVPEKRKQTLKSFESPQAAKGVSDFVDAYRDGNIELVQIEGTGNYEVNIFSRSEEIPYLMRLTKNSITNKWKILEP